MSCSAITGVLMGTRVVVGVSVGVNVIDVLLDCCDPMRGVPSNWSLLAIVAVGVFEQVDLYRACHFQRQ
jgi:hypothetical protein